MKPSAFDDPADKPLDPEVERVRRRLMRFMGVNLAILLVAVMAVLAGVVYKSMSLGDRPGAPAAMEDGPAGRIELPAGAEIISHTLSGDRLTLHFRRSDGSEAIVLYDLGKKRPVGTVEIVRKGNGG
jgi:hypothetical protein